MSVGVSLQDHTHSLATRGASSDESILAIFLDQSVSGVHSQAYTGGSERMPDAQTASPWVQLVNGDRAHLILKAQFVLTKPIRIHGLHVGQQLSGKGLVILEHVNVAELKAGLFQDGGRGVSRAE